MTGLFKRINFFKGLFMKEKDWKNEQEYHMEKQRFHNKYLHTPGVVPSCKDGLDITVSPNGNTLIAAPGYAIDGDGRDLYLPEAQEIVIPDLQSFNPPTTIYISIAYTESEHDRRENTSNPVYTGYAYIVESTEIDITDTEPDNYYRIELARANISGDGKLGELDKSKVKEAGAMMGNRLKGLSLTDFGVILVDTWIDIVKKDSKEEDTNILIEQYSKKITPPMYLVFLHSLDGTRARWSIECTENDQGTLDYTLHIKSESNRTITVYCRVFRIREG